MASSTWAAPSTTSSRLWPRKPAQPKLATPPSKASRRGGTLKAAPQQSPKSSAKRRMGHVTWLPLSHLRHRAHETHALCWGAGQEALLLEEGHTEQSPAEGTPWRTAGLLVDQTRHKRLAQSSKRRDPALHQVMAPCPPPAAT